MHATLTRASQHHQRGRRNRAAASFAFALAGLLVWPGEAGAERTVDIENTEVVFTGSLPQVRVDPLTGGVPHELTVDHTRAGHEGLELSARLRELGGLIRLPIQWRLYRMTPGTPEHGEKIHEASEPLQSLSLAPGLYKVEAEYGLVKVAQQVTVPEKQRIGLTLILNVGGIRPLSTVKNAPESLRAVARHEIYNSSGKSAKDRLIGDINQGEVVRLGAGTYRVVSTFYPGNTTTEQTVKVKPGILTSLHLDHQAAIANLHLNVPEKTEVNWQLKQEDHDWSASGSHQDTQIILAPGHYTLSARINGRSETRKFTIKAGQTAEITLN